MDISKFRTLYPAFDDVPEDALAMFVSYIESLSLCDTSELIQMLLLAHLCSLYTDPSRTATSSTIDKVSVSFYMPNGNFNAWLSSTPYGNTALGMLSLCTSTGMYVGGSMDRMSMPRI